jgi:ketosteroid isomerase-like protein
MSLRRITLHAVLIAAATMTCGVSFAKDDARVAALKAAELARFEANVAADAKALGQLLADDLEYVHSNGDFDTKASFIESLVSGKRDYVSSKADIQGVRILGDMAIIRGRALVTVADNGQSRDLDIGYTDIWVWKDKRWQMTAWRSARMPAPSTDKRSESGVREAVIARYSAALAGNTESLEKLLADDLDYCTFRGECQSKQAYLGEIRSGKLKYRSIEPTVDRVKIVGDVATAIGRVSVTASRDGTERSVALNYLAVLAWRDGRWQMTSFAAILPPPAASS